MLASDRKLRAAFTSFPDPAQAGQRQRAIEASLTAALEGENLFAIAGGNPLFNIFVLEPDGTLRADTHAGSHSVGMNFKVRDYYRAFFDARNPRPRDYVHVAPSFLSMNDHRYKIAVSTRIWGEREELLGLLVANFTIGPRLIDVDMHQEPGDAAVLCPMDESEPSRGALDPETPGRYIAVLDRRYDGSRNDHPDEIDPSLLPDFQGIPTLNHASRGPEGGRLIDYHRVGETPMIVVLRRACPWPLSWLPDFR